MRSVAGKPLLLQLPAGNLRSELCLTHNVMVTRWFPLDVSSLRAPGADGHNT